MMTERTAYQVRIFNELCDQHFAYLVSEYGFRRLTPDMAEFAPFHEEEDSLSDHYPDGHARRVYQNVTTALLIQAGNYGCTLTVSIFRLVNGEVAEDKKNYAWALHWVLAQKSPKNRRKRIRVPWGLKIPKREYKDEWEMIFASYENSIKAQAEALELHCKDLLTGDFTVFDAMANHTPEERKRMYDFGVY